MPLWLRSECHSARGGGHAEVSWEVLGNELPGGKMGTGISEGPLPSQHLFSTTLTSPGYYCLLPPTWTRAVAPHFALQCLPRGSVVKWKPGRVPHLLSLSLALGISCAHVCCRSLTSKPLLTLGPLPGAPFPRFSPWHFLPLKPCCAVTSPLVLPCFHLHLFQN